MPSDKNKVVSYKGTTIPQRGDLLWYDGENWVVLPVGTEGQILTVVDVGTGDLVPQWQNIP